MFLGLGFPFCSPKCEYALGFFFKCYANWAVSYFLRKVLLKINIYIKFILPESISPIINF